MALETLREAEENEGRRSPSGPRTERLSREYAREKEQVNEKKIFYIGVGIRKLLILLGRVSLWSTDFRYLVTKE